MVWDPVTGLPTPSTAPLLTKPQIEETARAAASTLYVPAVDPLTGLVISGEEEFFGMTNIEVAQVRRARSAAAPGGLAHLESLEDRILGKPKQAVETKNVTLTYQDMLTELARREEKPTTPDADADPLAS